MVFIDTKYRPDPRNDFVIELKIKPHNMSLLNAGEAIAEYTSLRFWDECNKDFPKESVKLKPKVCDKDDSESKIWISYPRDLFGLNNVSDLLSLYYKINSLGFLTEVKLTDIHIPSRSLTRFYGPRFGSSEFSKIIKFDGPYISVVLDKSLSLTPSSQAKLAYELWSSGVDMVREDFALNEISTNDFFQRVSKTLTMMFRAEKESGKKKLFLPNITSEMSEMITKADLVKNIGGNSVLINSSSCGASAISSLRKYSNVFIFGDFIFSQLEICNPNKGISPLAAAKITQLSGLDIINIGSPKIFDMVIGYDYTRYGLELEDLKDVYSSMLSSKKEIKPVLPFVGGGLYPSVLPELVSKTGRNIILDFNESCYDHPDGFKSGAISLVQAKEAIIAKKPIEQFAKGKKELSKSLLKWSN